MGVTALVGINAKLNARAVNFAKCTVVELIGRPHANVFHQDCWITSIIDFNLKLMPSPNKFVSMYTAPAANAVQENYKLVIYKVIVIIHT